jgi:hypothetical protein
MPPGRNALRKLRELRSAGKEFSSGGGRTLSSIRYAPHAFPPRQRQTARRRTAPGRQGLMSVLDDQFPLSSRQSAVTLRSRFRSAPPLRYGRPRTLHSASSAQAG